MTTVEELRESLVSNILGHIRWGGIDAIITPDPKVLVTHDVDALISVVDAAAFARGVAEGEERLQKYTAEYLKEGIKRCSAALAQARAEGAERAKVEIRKEAVDEHWGSIGEDVRRVCTVPTSILAPKENDNGKD